MSVDMETTRKTWNDVDEGRKKDLGELISEVQFALLYEFGIVQHGEGIEDTNDNGTWPVIDIEVHTGTDPDGSTRRLIVADDKDTLIYHTHKYPGTEGSGGRIMSNNNEYVIKISRLDFEHKVTDAQWERFCEIMDEDPLEYSILREVIDRNLEQAMEDKQ